MMDYRTIERQLSENLQLKNRPVAITFRVTYLLIAVFYLFVIFIA